MRSKLAIAAALTVAPLSGCGGGSSAGDAVRHAVAATRAAKGADVAVAAAVHVPASAQDIGFAGSGSADMSGRSAQLTIFFAQLGALARSGVAGSRAVQLEERFLYPLLYVRSALLPQRVTHGKPWVKLDVRSAAQRAGVDPTQLAPSDPSEYLRLLEGATGTPRQLGRESIRGVPTTHYRVRVDLRRVGGAAAARLVRAAATRELPVEVWIDGRQLVRRERLSYDIGVAPGQRVAFTIALDLSGFGPKPSATAPPTDQVTDLAAR